MSIGIPSVNDLKEAVLATTRALSQKADLDRDFTSNKDLEFTLPSLPKNKSELAFYRGKADAMACAKRFRDDEIFIDTGAQKLNSLLENLEDVRVEVLGSKRYPGVSANIKAKFEQKCRENFFLEDKEELLESALETWLRQILLKEIPTKFSKGSQFLSGLIKIYLPHLPTLTSGNDCSSLFRSGKSHSQGICLMDPSSFQAQP